MGVEHQHGTRKNGMGRWLWDVENVRKELIRGETCWSTLEEREEKVMVEMMLRLVFQDQDVGQDAGIYILSWG